VAGLLVAMAGVTVITLLIVPVHEIMPGPSTAIVYLLAVMLVSSYWGMTLGVLVAVASAAAFNFFYIPPSGSFVIASPETWMALCVYVIVALTVGTLGAVARAREVEADRRRGEADMAREMAQNLLGSTQLEDALPVQAQRLAAAFGVSSAALVLGTTQGDARHMAFPLRAEDGDRIGTLLLANALSGPDRERVAERIVPSLQSILEAALHRAQLQAEVVQTAALRRTDEMKTAVLRSVSHDLRTPVTAILAAAEVLDAEAPEGAREAREVVFEAATRLWRLIEKLLDLSLLEAGTYEPRQNWYSIDEVLIPAIEHVEADPGTFHLALRRELPLLRGDPAQLERAFANLLENAARYADGKPVSIRARVADSRLRVRIVDQGPGIPPSEQERIFMPFYRSPGGAHHQGSGLGLAIAKGFVEAAGGTIGVESLPGQGTSFVVEIPLPGGDAGAEADGGLGTGPAAAVVGDRSAELAGDPAQVS